MVCKFTQPVVFKHRPGIALGRLSNSSMHPPDLRDVKVVRCPSHSQNHSLSRDETKKLGLPSEGTWFWTQQPMLDARQDHGSCFTVARDHKKTNEKVVKIYGLFQSPKDFFECLRNVPADKRWYYELIPESSPCRAHADIEWIGELGEGHSRMQRVIEKIRSELKKVYPNFSAEIYVSCGSRPVNVKAYKHSYHLVISNLSLES